MYTDVISTSVGQHIVESFRLGHILSRLANDDSQLHFIVGEVLLDRLNMFGDSDRDLGTNQGRNGLVEEDGVAGPGSGSSKAFTEEHVRWLSEVSLGLQGVSESTPCRWRYLTTYSMVGIVETQTAHKANFFAGEGGKELLDSEDALGDLGGGVEGRARNFVGLNRVLLVVGEADCLSGS